jgi:hypothetical protein
MMQDKRYYLQASTLPTMFDKPFDPMATTGTPTKHKNPEDDKLLLSISPGHKKTLS